MNQEQKRSNGNNYNERGVGVAPMFGSVLLLSLVGALNHTTHL